MLCTQLILKLSLAFCMMTLVSSTWTFESQENLVDAARKALGIIWSEFSEYASVSFTDNLAVDIASVNAEVEFMNNQFDTGVKKRLDTKEGVIMLIFPRNSNALTGKGISEMVSGYENELRMTFASYKIVGASVACVSGKNVVAPTTPPISSRLSNLRSSGTTLTPQNGGSSSTPRSMNSSQPDPIPVPQLVMVFTLAIETSLKFYQQLSPPPSWEANSSEMVHAANFRATSMANTSCSMMRAAYDATNSFSHLIMQEPINETLIGESIQEHIILFSEKLPANQTEYKISLSIACVPERKYNKVNKVIEATRNWHWIMMGTCKERTELLSDSEDELMKLIHVEQIETQPESNQIAKKMAQFRAGRITRKDMQGHVLPESVLGAKTFIFPREKLKQAIEELLGLKKEIDGIGFAKKLDSVTSMEYLVMLAIYRVDVLKDQPNPKFHPEAMMLALPLAINKRSEKAVGEVKRYYKAYGFILASNTLIDPKNRFDELVKTKHSVGISTWEDGEGMMWVTIIYCNNDGEFSIQQPTKKLAAPLSAIWKTKSAPCLLGKS